MGQHDNRGGGPRRDGGASRGGPRHDGGGSRDSRDSRDSRGGSGGGRGRDDRGRDRGDAPKPFRAGPRGTGGAGGAGIPRPKGVPGASKVAKVERPPLPDDLPPLPRAAAREIQRVMNNKVRADEVAAALAVGSEKIEDEDLEGALQYLRWARQEAGASVSVREVLGIALYVSGNFAEARKELQAYRRMSERQDQNHLIADCLRALGRDEEQIPDLIDAMGDAPIEARAEGRIVWASAVGDGGDPLAGMAVLAPLLKELETSGDEVPDEVAARVFYVAGDLTQRADRDREAIRWFRRVVELGDSWDAEERLAALED